MDILKVKSKNSTSVPTRKLSTAAEEGLNVILKEAVVLQHFVEPLKILNMMLEHY